QLPKDRDRGSDRGGGEPLKRRGVLAALATLLAAGVARASERVAQAGGTDHQPLMVGEGNTPTRPTELKPNRHSNSTSTRVQAQVEKQLDGNGERDERAGPDPFQRCNHGRADE